MFENFIFAIIFFSSIILVITTYIKSPVIDDIDLFISFVFIGEMIFKIISLGFILDRGSYLTDSWNIFDFLIGKIIRSNRKI